MQLVLLYEQSAASAKVNRMHCSWVRHPSAANCVHHYLRTVLYAWAGTHVKVQSIDYCSASTEKNFNSIVEETRVRGCQLPAQRMIHLWHVGTPSIGWPEPTNSLGSSLIIGFRRIKKDAHRYCECGVDKYATAVEAFGLNCEIFRMKNSRQAMRPKA